MRQYRTYRTVNGDLVVRDSYSLCLHEKQCAYDRRVVTWWLEGPSRETPFAEMCNPFKGWLVLQIIPYGNSFKIEKCATSYDKSSNVTKR